MSWTDLVHETEGLLAVFQGRPPSLEAVEIHQASVDSDGWAISLRFDLQDYPATPPAKWAVREADVVQLNLSLGNLSSLAISGVLGPDVIGRIAISGDLNNRVELTAAAGEFRIEAVGEVASIRGFSAYTRGVSCFRRGVQR